MKKYIFCSHCGAKNPATSRFCYKCGNKLYKGNNESTSGTSIQNNRPVPSPTHSQPINFKVLIPIMFIIGAILYAVGTPFWAILIVGFLIGVFDAIMRSL